MLLDQIRDPARDSGTSIAWTLEASIRENIRRILATRQGSSMCVPDYGLPDLNDVIQDPDRAAQALVDRVKDVVERYEPRVTGVTVRRRMNDEPGFDPLAVCLEIKAQIVGPSGRRRTRISANVSSDGQIEVVGDGA